MQITFLMKQLDKETEERTAYQVLLQDKEEEIKIMQRKMTQSVKDLSKQLQLAQKKAIDKVR